MANTSGLLRKALAFIIIAAVAILAFKVLVAIVVGVAHTLFALALLAVVVIAVLWALRNL
jgi:heme A synthase